MQVIQRGGWPRKVTRPSTWTQREIRTRRADANLMWDSKEWQYMRSSYEHCSQFQTGIWRGSATKATCLSETASYITTGCMRASQQSVFGTLVDGRQQCDSESVKPRNAQRWNSWNVRPAFRYRFTIGLLLNKFNIDTTSKQLQLLPWTDTGIADVELPSGSARTRATGGVTETSYDSSLKSSIYTNSGGNSGRASIGANIPYYNIVLCAMTTCQYMILIS